MVAVLTLPQLAHAGWITGFSFSGSGSVLSNTADFPNNDDFSASLSSLLSNSADNENLVVALKQFYPPSDSGLSIDPIDMSATVSATEGVTEYSMVEFLVNNTALTWSDYHLQLGIQTENESGQATFLTYKDLLANTPDILHPDFDTPLPSSPAAGVFRYDAGSGTYESLFSDITHTATELTFAGGSLPELGFDITDLTINDLFMQGVPFAVYGLDVPDTDPSLLQNSIGGFVVRQEPSFPNAIPEPATIFLFSTGLLGTAWRRRRAA